MSQFSPEEFLEEFKELQLLYQKLKEIALLAETVSGDVVLASINEYRYALDHLMRSISPEVDMREQFAKAKAHLYRGAYDSYEVIAIIKLEQIKSAVSPFSSDVVARTFPGYYTEVLPKILEIETSLVECRSHKADVIHNTREFEQYEKALVELTRIQKQVSAFIGPLTEHKEEFDSRATSHRKKDNYSKLKWALIGGAIGIASGVTVQLIKGKLLDKPAANPPEVAKPK